VADPTPDVLRRLLRARDWMDRAYAGPLDVAAVAKRAGASPAHFARLFKGVFGVSPHQYLATRRIERAMALLRSTDRSVTEICFAVGFHSLGTFSRTFRDIVGDSPTEYRVRMASVERDPVLGRIPTCFTMAWMRPDRKAGSEKPVPDDAHKDAVSPLGEEVPA
jgi:AraC-like DNA-binding protein